ncbi:MAG: periplasmic heavy metal sensor [Rhodobacteraceae bacterium]|nr:periplasmic heavy metal sensor [Paracoccaceae bacterium]
MLGRSGAFWLKLVLALSLALNLVVAGTIVGALLHRGDIVRSMPLDPGRGTFAMIAMLPPERRDALREALGGRPGPSPADLAAGWADLRAVLLEPEITAATLQAQMSDIRRLQNEAGERLDAALAAELAAMSPAERSEYVARLERLRPGDRRFDDRHHGEGHRGPHDDRTKPDAD